MIPLIKPDLAFSEIADDIRKILDSGRLTNGQYVRDFEMAFSEYIGVSHAVSTTSATTALHMVLVAQGIGPGDEVLVSDFTFPASGNTIVQTGATPVLVDSVAGSFELDMHAARSLVTDRTKALMVVHPFGQPVDSSSLRRFSEDTGLWILEDAACAVAAHSGNTRCGAMGMAGAFSFHPRKILTTGEGGMITTDSGQLSERLTVLRAHGAEPNGVNLNFTDNGFNYRMSEIQAAMGLVQLTRIESIVRERRRIADLYTSRLAEIDSVSIPLCASHDECSFQSFVVLLAEDIDRNLVIREMKAAGIETTLGTYAMHSHPAFSRFGYTPGDLPHAWLAQEQSLTLPLFAGMSESDVDHIVGSLARVIR
jgi:dTDP-4-amino-4,6-dideoxygalactose transaminase